MASVLEIPCIEFGVVRIDSATVVCFCSPAGQLLLTGGGGKTRMVGVGIVFELYTASL